ncbi:MAG: NADH-quinone oxidoreductase subunit M [Alphaproteobacteria bacterium]|nr:NADH-quinone oxidoreductase subunit M [Alphaproteobacteria bacterium]
MASIPLLTITIFLPLLGVLAIMGNRGNGGLAFASNARWVALWTSLVTLGLALTLWGNFNPETSDFQFQDKLQWMPVLNVSYHVGLDGISLPFVLLSALLIPICILASWTAIQTRVAEFMVTFLVLETLLIGLFSSLDFILFYLFFEGVLIPMFLIIGIWGGPNRIYAAFKFFLYTFLGSVFMLLAILYVYFEVGGSSIPLALTTFFDPQVQTWLWLAFFASFAVKIPMFPFHTWLPDAHVEAPTAGSVILAGILLKMGGYGLIRFSIPMFPEASAYFTPMIFMLSIIAIIYTSLVALVQVDMKKLIAYSSIAHMGFVTLGIFTIDAQGMQGAVTQMVSHGLISSALFLCVGVVYDRIHSRQISDYGGLVHRMPRYAVFFMLFILASLGLPGTSGFVGEFLVLIGTYQVSTWAAALATISMVFGAAYGLWLYRRVVFGIMVHPKLLSIPDLNWREKIVFTPLLAGILILGIYPMPLLNLMGASLSHIIDQYNIAMDPEAEGIIDKKKSLEIALYMPRFSSFGGPAHRGSPSVTYKNMLVDLAAPVPTRILEIRSVNE